MTRKDHLVRQIQEHGDNLEEKERLMKELNGMEDEILKKLGKEAEDQNSLL
jgi:hypothetical protein